MAETRIYEGRIEEHGAGDNDEALFVGDTDLPIAEEISEDMLDHGNLLTVRYYISDEPRTEEQLIEGLIKRLSGMGEAEYFSHYSEITGYLWTDEELNVGGHDLMAELRSHTGKYCRLEITYNKPDD